jgi:hypothetical protein
LAIEGRCSKKYLESHHSESKVHPRLPKKHKSLRTLCFPAIMFSPQGNHPFDVHFIKIIARVLDLSGCNINAYFAIELSEALKLNQSIKELSLANCNLSSLSLSCLFQAVITLDN